MPGEQCLFNKPGDLNFKFFFAIFIFVFKTSFAEQEVDIWDNKNKKNANEEIKQIENDQNNSSIFNNNSVKPKQIIQEEAFNENDNKQFYGIWDPDKYNFDLTMWANTDGQNVKKIVKRINKLNLSETAEIIFQNTMFSFSYAPENLLEKDFLDLKVNWLIKNNKDDLVEKFLEKNEEFPNKKKIIHLHGGEITLGSYDNEIRNMFSKASNFGIKPFSSNAATQIGSAPLIIAEPKQT